MDLQTINKEIEINNLQKNNKSVYSTLKNETKDDKIKLYNALQQCDIRINDIKGEIIEMVDVYIEKTIVTEKDEKGNEIYDEKTGIVKEKVHYRSIVFGKDGKTYVSSAYGVFNSLSQLISIFGNPSKDNVIKVKVSTRPVKNSNFESLVLRLVNE